MVSLSGDPRIGSPTAKLARRAAAALAESLADHPTVIEIDLANVSAHADDLRRALLRARAVVVATPEQDGWPTSLLLDFLGGMQLRSLGGVPAAIVVTAETGDPIDVTERRLRKYLHELGADASLPTLAVDGVAGAGPTRAVRDWLAEVDRRCTARRRVASRALEPLGPAGLPAGPA
ncbi:MAG: NAD(P)H-dependent oxidoreductase [Solirubrobacteraceae bacterium]